MRRFLILPSKKFKLLISVGLAVLFLLASAKRTRATEFTSDYEVIYEIELNGQALVTQSITLTNNTSHLYPSEYTLSAQKIYPKNIRAFNTKTSSDLEVKVRSEGEPSPQRGTTLITVKFDEIVVGLGRQLQWNLIYETRWITQKYGRIWEITIPRMKKTADLRNYNLRVKIPRGFGPEDYVSPSPTEREETGDFWIYRFEQNFTSESASSIEEPISMAFGDYQLFDFKLKYHLQNPHAYDARTEIALLPDFSPYQKIYLRTLHPFPSEVIKDLDGNYLATYELAPHQILSVTFEGQALVKNFNQEELKKQPVQVKEENQQPYLLPAKYWEVNDPRIKDQLTKVQTDYGLDDNSSDHEWALAIYDYVTKNLTYDPERARTEEITRFGAVKSLENQENAVCMEFTDLLITLLRSAGIPARELDGYAYTENPEEKPTVSDVLHSWAQIYLPKTGWINVDPTWGSTTSIDFFTKLDTNHLIFVIKGNDSERPYPAGSYKINPDETGDVQVNFTENFTPGVIPFALWWQNWEMANQKVGLVDRIFRWFTEVF